MSGVEAGASLSMTISEFFIDFSRMSVRDLREVESRFTLRGLADRDDVIVVFTLSIRDGDERWVVVHSRSGSSSLDNCNSIERPRPGVREIKPRRSRVATI